jgi:hypothetical protein
MIRSDEEYTTWWDKLASYDKYDILERVYEEVGWTDKQKDLAESLLKQMKAKKPFSCKQLKIIRDWADRMGF